MTIIRGKKLKYRDYFIVFPLGAVLYGLIEILWRGFTHWSMILTGGCCLSCVYAIDKKYIDKPLWRKCITGCLVITSVEFVVGIIVNKLLHLNVWDYSEKFLNISGQICPLYSFFWFILCFPAFGICRIVSLISGKKSKSDR
ncbi:MAG: hypothetical protein PUE85_08765 [Firmicutes bacterium]|nr:hypothetical protein [Bacillota bacterium]